MREITKIHIHHTQTCNDDFTGDNHKRILKSIRNFHKKVRGWGDVGYHNFVFADGAILADRKSVV